VKYNFHHLTNQSGIDFFQISAFEYYLLMKLPINLLPRDHVLQLAFHLMVLKLNRTQPETNTLQVFYHQEKIVEKKYNQHCRFLIKDFLQDVQKSTFFLYEAERYTVLFFVFLVSLAEAVNNSAGATFNCLAGTFTDTIRTFSPWPKRILQPVFSPTILCVLSLYFQ